MFRVLGKLDFVTAVAGAWQGPASIFDELVRGAHIRWDQYRAAVGRPLRWVGDEESRRVVECLVEAAKATETATHREEWCDEWERRRREIDAEVRLAARLREESFQRELRDRRHREEQALGGIMILGGILGAKKW